jgi:molecular chaperone GrpE
LEDKKSEEKKSEKEMKLIRIEYTKQVKENEETVKRYRKMIEDEKLFAITKFAKDLLEVRDAVRLALENTDVDAVKKEKDLAALKQQFESNIEGQVMTAEVMDKVLGRFNVSHYDPQGDKFDPKLHEAVFTVAQSE